MGIKDLLDPWFHKRGEAVRANTDANCRLSARINEMNHKHTRITFFMSGQNIGTLTFNTDRLVDELVTFTSFFNENPWEILPEIEELFKP